MRYWVYINDKVEGPFDEGKLVTLSGFTPDTLLCAEDSSNSGNQEWVKASSIFEFEEPAPAAAPVQPAAQQAPAMDNSVMTALLAKLDALTNQLSNMQQKIDGLQNQLDVAVAAQNRGESPATVDTDKQAYTISLTRHDLAKDIDSEELAKTQYENGISDSNLDATIDPLPEEKPLDMLEPLTMESSPINETSEVVLENKEEEESIVSAALSSMYASQQQEEEQKDKKEDDDSAFQDLLNPTQAKELEEESKQKAADIQENPQPDNAVTADVSPADATANADADSEREALITALTAAADQSTADNVVDQVIQERETDKEEQDTVKLSDAAVAAAAGAAAVAGAAALMSDNKNENAEVDPSLEAQLAQQLPGSGTTQEEKILPADQLPPDVEPKDEKGVTMPFMDLAGRPHLEDVSQSSPEEKDEKLEELVPGAAMEPPEGIVLNAHDLDTAFIDKQKKQAEKDKSMDQIFGAPGESPTAPIPDVTTDEQPTDAQPTSEQPAAKQPAAEQPVAEQPAADPQEQVASSEIPTLEENDSKEATLEPLGGEVQTSKNKSATDPNELTEIELKEGSTYLISDFVPPAKADDVALPQEFEKLNKQTTTTGVEEMLAPTKQTQVPVETDKDAPKDMTASQVSLENTLQSKRGATLDIKTVPMVPEPEKSERLNLDGLEDDINAQHDIKSADERPSANKITKLVIGLLVVFLLAAVSYGMLAFMNIIPEKFNVLASGKEAQAQAEQAAQLEEMLPDTPAPADPMQAALEDVKNYLLPNGSTLQAYIEAKHASVKDGITWDISTAVDPDNYSVLIKVPPENPQSFKISYRFNYNTVTKALEPTISDAKNLMDEVGQSSVPSVNNAASAIPADTTNTVSAIPAQ